MTQSILIDAATLEKQRGVWVAEVEALVSQIAQWSQEEGWVVSRTPKTLTEKRLGPYEVSSLRIELGAGELLVEPIAFNQGGDGGGRVDLEAYPTLSRVKLIGGGPNWRIVTDSNVPIRVQWGRDTFMQLAEDLLA